MTYYCTGYIQSVHEQTRKGTCLFRWLRITYSYDCVAAHFYHPQMQRVMSSVTQIVCVSAYM